MIKLINLFIVLITLTGFQGIDDVMICESTTAKAYHLYKEKPEEYCLGLKRCGHPIKTVLKSDAVKLGRTPCCRCYSGTNTTPANTSPCH